MVGLGLGLAAGVLPGNVWPPVAGGTNLLHFSEDFTAGSWTKNNTVVTADATTDPIGGTAADLLTIAASGFVRQFISLLESSVVATTTCAVTSDWQRFQVTITAVSGNSYVFSVYLKAALALSIDIKLQSTGTGQIRSSIIDDAGTAPAVYAWGAQLEPGTTAGTYSPTFS